MFYPNNNTSLGVLPARWGSERFPGKPLAMLGGKPVIQWTWEAAGRCSELSDVLIATDDDRIRSAAEAFGAKVAMTSPDCPSGSDRVAEALTAWESETGQRATFVANLQGDEPFLDPAVVDRALSFLRGGTDGFMPDVTTAVSPITSADMLARPSVVKAAVSAGGRALYFSRNPVPSLARSEPAALQSVWQSLPGASTAPLDKPPLGFHHIGLYCFRADALRRFVALPPAALEQIEKLEQLRLLENGLSIGIIGTQGAAPGIDTPEDLERAELMLLQQGDK